MKRVIDLLLEELNQELDKSIVESKNILDSVSNLDYLRELKLAIRILRDAMELKAEISSFELPSSEELERVDKQMHKWLQEIASQQKELEKRKEELAALRQK